MNTIFFVLKLKEQLYEQYREDDRLLADFRNDETETDNPGKEAPNG